jgi:hypothetical protein
MGKLTLAAQDFEVKWQEIKEKSRNKFRKGCEWFERNKEAIIVVTPIVIGGVTTIVKTIGKRVNLNKEESIKNLYCYDRSLGHYWRLKRELSNKEWLEIDQRKKSGERLADILSELRVLK